MSKAKIEIYGREIDGLYFPDKGVPNHMFILISYEDGRQNIIRGGPERQSVRPGDLVIVHSEYAESKKYLFPNDYFTAVGLSKLPKVLIVESTNEEIKAFEDIMVKRLEHINQQMFDYRLSVFDGSRGASQNSNTAVKDLIKSAGLVFKLPINNVGEEIWAPGWRSSLDDSVYGHVLGAVGMFAVSMQKVLVGLGEDDDVQTTEDGDDNNFARLFDEPSGSLKTTLDFLGDQLQEDNDEL